MSDINQIRRFLYNKQPGKKEVLSEVTAHKVTIEVVGDRSRPGTSLKDGQTFRVSSVEELLKAFGADRLMPSASSQYQLTQAFTQEGRTLFAYLDPSDMAGSGQHQTWRTLYFFLSRAKAEAQYKASMKKALASQAW